MRPTLIGFAACLIAAITSPLSLPTTASATEPIVGTWQGIVDEKGFGTYDATLVFEKAEEGSSFYPVYDCDGRLTLISAEGGIYAYYETITRGRFRCIDGHIQMIVDGDALSYVWTEELQSDDVISAGEFRRLEQAP